MRRKVNRNRSEVVLNLFGIPHNVIGCLSIWHGSNDAPFLLPQTISDYYNYGREQNRSVEMKNPPWTRDEHLLALDFYLSHAPSIPAKDSREVLEFSGVLNQLHSYLEHEKNENFRNANRGIMIDSTIKTDG